MTQHGLVRGTASDFNFTFDPALVTRAPSGSIDTQQSPTPGSKALLASLPVIPTSTTANVAGACVLPPNSGADGLELKRNRRSKKKKFDPYPLPESVLEAVATVSSEQLTANPGRYLSAAVLVSVQHTYLPSGETLSLLFDSERRFLRVHSGAVGCTQGTLEAILEYNAVGPNRVTRKLKLCPHYEKLMMNAVKIKPADTEQHALEYRPLPAKETLVLSDEVCDGGFRCPFVHLAAKRVGDHVEIISEQFRHNYVHWRKVRSNQQGYERFDHGILLPLAEPNSHAAASTDCSTILVTQGASDFLSRAQEATLLVSGAPGGDSLSDKQHSDGPSSIVDPRDGPSECSETPRVVEKELKELQHCAHYKKNGMCCLGPSCKFVHALGTAEEEAAALQVDMKRARCTTESVATDTVRGQPGGQGSRTSRTTPNHILSPAGAVSITCGPKSVAVTSALPQGHIYHPLMNPHPPPLMSSLHMAGGFGANPAILAPQMVQQPSVVYHHAPTVGGTSLNMAAIVVPPVSNNIGLQPVYTSGHPPNGWIHTSQYPQQQQLVPAVAGHKPSGHGQTVTLSDGQQYFLVPVPK